MLDLPLLLRGSHLLLLLQQTLGPTVPGWSGQHWDSKVSLQGLSRKLAKKATKPLHSAESQVSSQRREAQRGHPQQGPPLLVCLVLSAEGLGIRVRAVGAWASERSGQRRGSCRPVSGSLSPSTPGSGSLLPAAAGLG